MKKLLFVSLAAAFLTIGFLVFQIYPGVHKISDDFIPIQVQPKKIPSATAGFFVRLRAANASTSINELAIPSKQIPSYVFIPIGIQNGPYEMDILASPYMGDGMDPIDESKFVSVYKTSFDVERAVADDDFVTIRQINGPTKDNFWSGIRIQPFKAGNEINFLDFQIENDTSSALTLQSFEMGTEAGGKVLDIDSFSLYNSTTGVKLSSLSDLSQLADTGESYSLYHADYPVRIAPKETLNFELRGVYHPGKTVLFGPSKEEMVRRSAPYFSVVRIYANLNTDVFRKNINMTARAMFYDPTNSGLLIPVNY